VTWLKNNTKETMIKKILVEFIVYVMTTYLLATWKNYTSSINTQTKTTYIWKKVKALKG